MSDEGSPSRHLHRANFDSVIFKGMKQHGPDIWWVSDLVVGILLLIVIAQEHLI